MKKFEKNPIEIINLRFSGMLAWNVVNSHGSYISMHFGIPRLYVNNITENNKIIRRIAHIHGDGELWIYMANWYIVVNGSNVASSDDNSETIRKSMRLIQGQILKQIRTENNNTYFDFDLNTTIITSKSNSAEPQWIFSIDSHVFYEHLA